jgi:hypothetical protein
MVEVEVGTENQVEINGRVVAKAEIERKVVETIVVVEVAQDIAVDIEVAVGANNHQYNVVLK